MEITCKPCGARFKLPADKLPAGKVLTIPCPKCKKPITVSSNQEKTVSREVDGYDAGDRPFDFIEEEGKTALICEMDASASSLITSVLEGMEFSVRQAASTRDALKQMRYHQFDMIAVNERFDAKNPDVNGVLVFLERLAMSVRRNIFVLLFTDRYRTMDRMMAFNRSVNLIVNIGDLSNLERILNKSIADHEFFYRAFKEALKDAGKAM
ncbi:MAG: zinc-ribbon domain-containing protein [Desulfobacterales bacterium]|jgi:predicted Zn finger-like uncharacterized protein